MAGATGVSELINLRYHQQAYSKASAKEEMKFESRCEFCTCQVSQKSLWVQSKGLDIGAMASATGISKLTI